MFGVVSTMLRVNAAA